MFNKIASTFLIKIIVAFINLAIVVLLSQLIGAEGKGESSLVLTSIAMLLLFTNIIGGPSLIYFVPRYNTFFLFIVSNLWSVIVCVASYFFLIQFNYIPNEFVLPVVLLSLINSLLATNTSILYGKEKIAQANYILLIQALVNIIVLYLLIINFHQSNVFGYINSLYAAFGLCFIISLAMTLKHLQQFEVGSKNYHSTFPSSRGAGGVSLEKTIFRTCLDFSNAKQIIKEMFKLGLVNQLGHFLKFMSFRFIYYIIVKHVGEASLGTFSNANSITESVLLITNSYIAVIHPRISNSSDKNYSINLTLKYTKHSIILCSIALVALTLFPDTFWIWLFGADFAGIKTIILCLCPGIFFYNIGLIVGHYFSGTGKPQINTIGNFVGLITTFSLIYFILPHFDLVDISIISTVSYFTTTLVILIHFILESKTKIHHIFPSLSDIKDLKNDILLLLIPKKNKF